MNGKEEEEKEKRIVNRMDFAQWECAACRLIVPLMHCIKFTVQEQQQQRLLMHNSLNGFLYPQFPSLLPIAFHLPAYSILLFSKLLYALWDEIHEIATEDMKKMTLKAIFIILKKEKERKREFLEIFRENENYFWTYWNSNKLLKELFLPLQRIYKCWPGAANAIKETLRPNKVYAF